MVLKIGKSQNARGKNLREIWMDFNKKVPAGAIFSLAGEPAEPDEPADSAPHYTRVTEVSHRTGLRTQKKKETNGLVEPSHEASSKHPNRP